MATVVAMDTLGRTIKALRKQCGWSQEQLAAELQVLSGRATFNREELSRWETGKRHPTPYWIDLLARALGVPINSLRPTAVSAADAETGGALRAAHEWLLAEPPQIFESKAGRRIGAKLAARIQGRVVELRHLDDELSGEDLAPLVLREYAATHRLVDQGSYTAEVGRSLLTSLGELGQITGWVLSDAGLHTQAQAHYLDGFAAARAAGDTAGAANLLSCLAYQWVNLGNATDAALLAATAERVGRSTTPAVRTLLGERLAYAHAHLGDHDRTARELDRVDELYDRRQPGDADPEWVYWLSRDEILVMAARCWTQLGDARRAGPQLADVLTRYSTEQVREQALYRAFLSEAHLNAGELDAAADALDCAAGYAAATASARANVRITDLRVRLAVAGRG